MKLNKTNREGWGFDPAKLLAIIALRVWIGLLRIERAARLDATLTTYGACPEKLTADLVREVLADVDTDIARAQARVETLRADRREPGTSPVWPVWLLAGGLLLVLIALHAWYNTGAPAAQKPQAIVWRYA
jgi:cytochrome c-type biogenesis protein CcmH/NrfG